jgi:hypothetical protein
MQRDHVPTLVALASLTLGFASACESETAEMDSPATIEDLTERPALHYGQRFAVAGEVEEMYDPQTFVIGGTDFFDHELLVRSLEPLPVVDMRTAESPAVEGDIVHVTGELRPYVRTEVESELDWTLDTELEIEHASKPVLIASSVLVSPRDPDAKAMQGVARLEEPVEDITLIIAADPANLTGQTVQLGNMTVRSLVEGEGFWIGPSHGRQMFVRADAAPEEMGVEIGERVDLEGELKATPPPRALESKWGLSDVQASLLDGEPVYLDAATVSEAEATS